MEVSSRGPIRNVPRVDDVDFSGPSVKRRRLDNVDVVSRLDVDGHSLTLPPPYGNQSVSLATSVYDDEDDLNSTSDGKSTPPTPLTPSTPRDHSYPSRRKTRLCPYADCTKAFNRPARLEEHIRSHTNTRPFACPHPPCDKAFLRQSHLAHHIKSAHSAVRDYVCDREGCAKRFVTATRLRRHLQAHDGRDKYRCVDFPPCDQTFRKHATLQRHIDMEHYGVKPFRCGMVDEERGLPCECGYDTAMKLRAHETKMHGFKRYWCSYCIDAGEEQNKDLTTASAAFSIYADLQIHIKAEHPARCEDCQLVCSSAADLEKHIATHHTRIAVAIADRKQYPCLVPTCGKIFTKQSNLNTHVRTVHSDARPFVCGKFDVANAADLSVWDGDDACGQAFAHKSALENHVRRIHLAGGNPRATRQEAKRRVKRAARKVASLRTSTLSRLTGTAIEADRNEKAVCVVSGCTFEAALFTDVEAHGREVHGMSEDEVFAAIMEQQALNGGRFWIGGDDVDGSLHTVPPSAACADAVEADGLYQGSFEEDFADMQQLIHGTFEHDPSSAAADLEHSIDPALAGGDA